MPDMPDRSGGIEEIASQSRWVRELAIAIARDARAGEDAAQDALLAAWRRRGDAPHHLAAWLSVSVRRILAFRARTDARRGQRERDAARPEHVDDDPARVLERIEAQEQLLREVRSLDEPYRSTVLLRWYEGVELAEIARRGGVPVRTVQTRLTRALRMLRERLDRASGGDRSRWLAAWIPLLPTSGPILGTRILEKLIMTTRAKVTLVAIAAGIVVLVGLQVFSRSNEDGRAQRAEEPAGALHSTPSIAASAASADATSPTADAASPRDESATPAERGVVPPPEAPTTGALRLSVVWADDKKPAAGVLISLFRPDADPLFDEPYATSDEQGTVRYTSLKPGRVYASIHRGETEWGDVIPIEAGKEAERTVEVAIGVDCTGLVVDGGNKPIADAEVLVSGWGGGESLPLARTASDGTFSLRAISTHCHIGARAPGFAASHMRTYTAGKGAKVQCRIVLDETAAEMRGTVLDPQGHAIAGAVVQAGSVERKIEKLPDGAFATPPAPARARTDADGRFEFRSLAAGNVSIAVRARGLAPWKQSVELASGKTKQLTVQLEPGVTLAGSVRDASGNKVSRATIQVGEWDDLGHRTTYSDANGNFGLEGLAAGDVKVHAERDGQGTAETTLHAESTLRWDAVLSSGLVFRGRVLDADGKPVNHAMIEAQSERDAAWFTFEGSDEAGRFRLQNCVADAPMRITVRHKSAFPETTLWHVAPSNEELVIRLPKEAWIYIQGKVVDPDDKPLANVHVSPIMKGAGGSPAETVDPATGAFRYGPYPPGEYQLRVQAENYALIQLPLHAVGPDEVWDVGTLKCQRGGSLLLNITYPSGMTPPHPCGLSIFDASGEYVDQVNVQDGVGRAGPLAPGSYSVQIAGEGLACRLQPFEVQAGVEMRVDVQVERGIAVEVECLLPESEPSNAGMSLVITDAAGTVVSRSTAWTRETSAKVSFGLKPGAYRIEASRDGLKGEASFTISGDVTPARVSVQLTKR
jgi:RNA polymerase sigma-70 factor (ECF subfamily)